jgi:uncharacterized membrane protein
MTNIIEETDRKQQRCWLGFLSCFFLLLVLLIVRHIFAEYDLNSGPLGIAVLTISIALLIVMLVLIIRLGLLSARAKADPKLKEALIDNELVRHDLARSWKSAFIAAAITPFIFLLISSFHPIDDPLLVALATPIVGSGAFLTSFYHKSNK